MTVYALVNSATKDIEVRYEWGDKDPGTLPAPTREGFKWLRFSLPEFDGSISRLVVLDNFPDDATEVPLEVVPIPADELAEQAQAAIKAQLAAPNDDVVDLLEEWLNDNVTAGKLSLDGLPQAAQDKLAARAILRAQLTR